MAAKSLRAIHAMLAFLLVGVPLAYAGHNNLGSARLSWSPDSVLLNLPSSPPGRQPLYLLLSNAPDVRKLSVTFRWTPNSVVGPCYYIVPDTAGAGLCGYNTLPAPVQGFAGDTLFDKLLRFPPGATPACIYYLVGGEHCTTVPATFHIGYVYTEDSNGQVDSLHIGSDATILGGAPDTLFVQRTTGRQAAHRYDAVLHNSVLQRPSNDADAFTDIDLASGTALAAGVQPHITHPQWPTSLDTPTLVVGSTSSPLGVFQSHPYDGIGGLPNAKVHYSLDPPLYITDLAMFLEAGKTFDGVDALWQDRDKLLQSVTLTYQDGVQWQKDMRMGQQVRNWRDGSQNCVPDPNNESYFVSAPTDQTVLNVYAGAGKSTGNPIDDPQTVYYDCQHLTPPAAYLGKGLTGVDLTTGDIPHDCDLDGTSGVFGLAAWPVFTIDNVPYYSQTSSLPFGGYSYGGTTVGSRRTFGSTACGVASMAMAMAHFVGGWMTKEYLNTYLVNNHGYYQDLVANLTSINGTTVYFEQADPTTRLRAGDTFVIERIPYRPIANVHVDGAGVGHITNTWSENGTVSAHDGGYVYWNANAYKAAGASNGAVVIEESSWYNNSTIERELALQYPVSLLTHNHSGHGHWVVAKGRSIHWKDSQTAQGTYAINDPAYNNAYLYQDTFNNEWWDVRLFYPPGGRAPEDALFPAYDEANSFRWLSFTMSGHAFMKVRGPGGNLVISLDGLNNQYVQNAKAASVARSISDDNDDPSSAIDQLLVAVAPDGVYQVSVLGQGDGVVSLLASVVDSNDGDIASASAWSNVTASSGWTFPVTYSAATGSISIGEPVAASVLDFPRGVRSSLRVRGCPCVGVVSFDVQNVATDQCVDIFDVTGRRVSVVRVNGRSSFEWAPEAGIGAGMYFARLRGIAGSAVRFVLVH